VFTWQFIVDSIATGAIGFRLDNICWKSGELPNQKIKCRKPKNEFQLTPMINTSTIPITFEEN
jgi:hypothetical protein